MSWTPTAFALESVVGEALSAIAPGVVKPLIRLISEYAEYKHMVSLVMEESGRCIAWGEGPWEEDDGTVKSYPALVFGSPIHHDTVRRVRLDNGETGDTVTVVGHRATHAFFHTGKLDAPYALALDPIKPGGFYVADRTSVRVVHPDGEVRVVAGTNEPGFKDGRANEARFFIVSGLLVTADGQTLYCVDNHNCRIRKIVHRTASESFGHVETVCGSGRPENEDGVGTKAALAMPQQIIWAYPPPHNTESHMLIGCSNAIRWFDIKSGAVSTVRFKPHPHTPPSPSTLIDLSDLSVAGMCMTPSQTVLFTCSKTQSLFALNPHTGEVEVLSIEPPNAAEQLFRTTLPRAFGICISPTPTGPDNEYCAYLALFSIMRVTLHSGLFVPLPSKAVPTVKPSTSCVIS